MTTTDTTPAHRFTIRTWAETRSNRRDRTHLVAAPTAAEACAHAETLARRATRTRSTISTEIVDVDGQGAPTDCEHMQQDPHQPFSWRTDGGRDCPACTGGGPCPPPS